MVTTISFPSVDWNLTIGFQPQAVVHDGSGDVVEPASALDNHVSGQTPLDLLPVRLPVLLPLLRRHRRLPPSFGNDCRAGHATGKNLLL